MKRLFGNPLLRLALRRPGLWPDLLETGWAFRRRGWYRRPPFLPLPSDAYMRWRLETAYGEPDAVPPPDELERFVRWSVDMRRRMRPRRRPAPPLWIAILALLTLAALWFGMCAGSGEALLGGMAQGGPE